MDRRDSLKALAIGSFGAVSPLVALENIPWMPEATKKEGLDNQPEQLLVPGNTNDWMRTGTVNHDIVHLIADNKFLSAVAENLPASIKPVSMASFSEEKLLNALASGEAMAWIGNPENLPKALSVGAFKLSTEAVAIGVVENTPVSIVDDLKFKNTSGYSGYIAPPKDMPYHNIDEEVRADFVPILTSRDRYGNLIGYPAVLMNYFAPSLAAGRFRGSECFFFFFDKPLETLDADGWKKILIKLSDRRKSGLQLTAFNSNYACYKQGERAQIRVRVENYRPKAVSAVVKLSVRAPGETTFTKIAETRRVAEGQSHTEALCDFRPQGKIGLWTILLEIYQDVGLAEKLAMIGQPEIIDRREMGFLLLDEQVQTSAIMEFKGAGITFAGREGFWAGTHYYPSTSWWEWAWKDFRPMKAAEDFAAIRKAGYRIVRVWIDPVIDEPVLRAVDAAIWLAAQNGIVLDVCIFTQWVRMMGFERPSGEHVLFEYRNPKDFNVVSFSLRNLELQREFVSILGSRWKNAGNIFYNLANEVYLKDPDASQMDQETTGWKEIPEEKGTVRDSLLFRRWAQEMTMAIRASGGDQYIMPGYMFSTLDGGDVYLGNADSPVMPWHSYLPPEETALTLQYFDSISSGRPILLEEFGTLGWNSVKHYDADVHYALGAGAASAISYEWGVSWLSRESCYWPLPLLEASAADNPDPRWFAPYLELGKIWSENGVGLCATPSGTGYGSIYHGTPFPAEAAVALGRLSLMGGGLQRAIRNEQVYVVIPASTLSAQDAVKKTLKALWAHKALYGIFQETELSTVPQGIKALICPSSLTAASRQEIQRLRRKGVKIFASEKEWSGYKHLERATVTNGEQINLLTRRTSSGTLFTLVGKEHNGPVVLKYGRSTATISMSDFGLIHITDKGVVLLEGEGEFQTDHQPFCRVFEGRLIVAAEDGADLGKTKKLKLMVTRPTKISFEHFILGVALSDGFEHKPQYAGSHGISGKVLDVDDQMAKYVIHLSF